MSLDIILPQFAASLHEEAGDSESSETQTSTHATSLELTLRDHSLQWLETLVNTKNVQSPWLLRHTSPRMVCIGPHTGHVCSRTELFSSIAASKRTNYLYHLELAAEATHALVDEKRGHGSVFVTATARGFYAGEEAAKLGRGWVARLDWRWWGSFAEGRVGDAQYGRWVCVRLVGLTGQSGLPGLG